MKKWSFVALLLIGATLLGATVLREPLASAAQTVSATIVGPLDGQGNVAVHEQGTADVNVTNSSLSVAPAAPISGGGDFPLCKVGPGDTFPFAAETASALSIGMTGGVNFVRFLYQGDTVATFMGPGSGHGSSAVNIALARPITFDRLSMAGESSSDEACFGWTGNQP
jgi:hypothetical protein